MTIYGYARVSKEQGQDPALQVDALKAAGCDVVLSEHASGATRARPVLDQLLGGLVDGDVVVVWKIDRLTRSVRDLVLLMDKLNTRGVGLRSLTEPIDTTTPIGRAMVQIIGVMAELERETLIERTQAGIEAARRRGMRFGRPPALTTEQEAEVIAMVRDGRSQASVARLLSVSPATISRVVRRAAAPHPGAGDGS